MKLQRKLLLILCLIFALFLTTNYGGAEAKAETIGKPVLTIKSTDEDNYVHLNWTSPDKDKYYSYRLFSKESSEPLFQSIPSKAKVKVLNIYPEVGNNLKTWIDTPALEKSKNEKEYSYIKDKDGNFITNGKGLVRPDPKNPNQPYKNEKGYVFAKDSNGQEEKGLISVEEIPISKFNDDISKGVNDLYDNKGEYKYDVVYQGGFDSNNRKYLSEDSLKKIHDFIKSGRGYLAGHDTAYSNLLLSDMNMSTFGNDYTKYMYGHTSVKINKKGLLTNYPWNICEIGDILTIPMSHGGQLASGDVWFKYTNNTWNAKNTEVSSFNNVKGTNNFYLTTWNNTAMIQTGHSNGKATPDEQKILTNTLFYLAQISEDTKWDDHKGQDLKAPTKPNIKSVNKNAKDKDMTISFEASEDIGSSYDYYVEAKEKSTGNTVKSDTKTTNVTSGLKGYSIVVDQNKDTVPDGSITTTSTDYVFDKIYDSDFYVHVAAVDNAGNMSEVSTFKYSYPVLKLTPNTTENVKDKVIITAEASSEGNSIEKIITPDGKEVSGDKAEYTAIEDKVYVFKAIDSNGNTVEASIDIENITADVILNAEPETHKLRIDENFAVTLNVDHVCNIGTVDLIVKYDSSKLKLLGATKIPGIIYYGDKLNEGEYRITLTTSPAALISSKNNLIKLHFRTLAPGKVDINVTKGRVSDGETEILRNCECGGTTVEIVDRKLKAMTLNDIFIISQHAGEDPEKLYPAIDADLNLDGKIDKADVDKAYKLMLQNPNENM